MDFEELLDRRKSVRRFLDKAVPEDVLNRIINAAIKAPTSCNTQLWNFIIIRNKEVKERLVSEAAATTLIARAPVVILPTHDNAIKKEAVQNIMLAIQNMLLEASNTGLGAVCINSIGNPEKIKKILGIPETELFCSFVLIGYPSDEDKNSPLIPRRQIKDVVHHDKWEQKREKVFAHNPEKWKLENISDYQRFYCRKTFPGKEMDIMAREEKELAGKILENEKGPFLDLLTYDGSYLSQFPKGENITTSDLNEQTMLYTKHAYESACKGRFKTFKQAEYGKLSLSKEKYRTITMLYKAERLPVKELENAIKTAKNHLEEGGKIIIIGRRKYSLYGVLYFIIRRFFSDDIRKTGIFSFFGPYKPIRTAEVKRMLKKEGLKTGEEEYFLVPPIYDMAYQMHMQFKKSKGTSFLHRTRREDIISRTIRKILDVQGINKSCFGAVTVITATK